MEPSFSFAEVTERLKKTLGIQKDADLARFLEVDHRKYAVWKSRAFLPLELIVELCDRKKISINYILYGRGTLHVAQDDETAKGVLWTILDSFRKSSEVHLERMDKHPEMSPSQKALILTTQLQLLLYKEDPEKKLLLEFIERLYSLK